MEGNSGAIVGEAEVLRQDGGAVGGRAAVSSVVVDETFNILQTCNMFNAFMDKLSIRGTVGLTETSIDVIHDLKRNMIKFINDDPNVYIPQKEKDKGARPKIFKKSGSETVKPTVPEISSSDSDSISSGCVASSDTSTVTDSDTSIRIKKKKSKLRGSKKHGRTDSESDSRKVNTTITKLLRKIDNRQLPKLERFSEESGQSLTAYLVKFENYCKESFRGPKDLWISELENHLKGSILDTFSSIRDFNDSYQDLKHKLLKSYNGNKEIRKRHYRQKFGNARPKPKESMYMFSVRLE